MQQVNERYSFYTVKIFHSHLSKKCYNFECEKLFPSIRHMKNKKIYLFAFFSWLIPFIVSAFFVDPKTNELTIDPLLFHASLFVIFALVVFYFYRKIRKKSELSLSTAHIFVGVNLILDIIVLLLLLQAMSVSEWLLTIAPVYPIVGYLMYYRMKR